MPGRPVERRRGRFRATERMHRPRSPVRVRVDADVRSRLQRRVRVRAQAQRQRQQQRHRVRPHQRRSERQRNPRACLQSGDDSWTARRRVQALASRCGRRHAPGRLAVALVGGGAARCRHPVVGGGGAHRQIEGAVSARRCHHALSLLGLLPRRPQRPLPVTGALRSATLQLETRF